VTQYDAIESPTPERSATGAARSEDALRVVRAPVHEVGARSALAVTAGTLAWRDGVAGVELSRRDGGLMMTITFDDARRRAEWLAEDHDSAPADQTAPRKPIQPLFWKRWILSMIAVYPALILLVYLTRPLTAGMHDAAALFIVAFLLTGLSTGLIMPFLHRRLGHWLAAR
jgi:hypothetical protein